MKRTIIILILLALALVGCNGSQSASPTATAQPTKPVASVKTASAPTAIVVATNGKPQLGGPLSDFKMRYGIESPQTDSVTAFVEGPGLHGGSLSVTYNKSGIVTTVVYSGPDNWTKKQYKEMMLSFMPMDAKVNNLKHNTDALTSYTSTSIGNFDEQLTDGIAGIHIV